MTVTARPRPTARPRDAATSRSTAYQCWVEAGGGTPSYDGDQYMALLRDHGVLKPRRTLPQVLVTALMQFALDAKVPWTPAEIDEYAAMLAPILIEELGRDGYRIHDVRRCIRPGDPALIGRPMSPEEERQVGIAQGPRAEQVATDLAPAAAASPTEAPREPGTGASTFEHITPEGDRFLVPEGWTPGDKSSRCRSCQALILWAVTPRGKRAPVDPDGVSHFSSCPDAAAWRKQA